MASYQQRNGKWEVRIRRLNNSNLSNWLNKRDLKKQDCGNEINYYQVGKLVNSPLNNNIKKWLNVVKKSG